MNSALLFLLTNIDALLYFLFYVTFVQKRMAYQKDWWKLVLYIAGISLYMRLSQPYIMVILRLVLVPIITLLLFTLLLEKRRLANLAIIVASFAIVQSIAFASGIIGHVIAHIAQLPAGHFGERILAVSIYLAGGLFLYHKIKSDKFKNILSALRENEIQMFIYCVGVVVLGVFLYFNITEMMELAGAEHWAIIAVFAGVLLGAVISAVQHMRRYIEKRALQKEKERLQTENIGLQAEKAGIQTIAAQLQTSNVDFQIENAGLKETNTNLLFATANLYRKSENLQTEKESLVKQQSALHADMHSIQKVVPAVVDSLDIVLEGKDAEDMRRLVIETKAQLNHAYIRETRTRLRKAQRQKDLPVTSWIVLNNYFKVCNERAVEAGVYLTLSVEQDVNVLDELNISPIDILSVFADHMDNSFRAIERLSDDIHGAIEANFTLKNNVYEITISDNAPAFPLEIIARLGERGISTRHGGGNGFANTLETLSLFGASLIVREYIARKPGLCNKRITVHFDGLRQFKIQSHRTGEIKAYNPDCTATIEQNEGRFR